MRADALDAGDWMLWRRRRARCAAGTDTIHAPRIRGTNIRGGLQWQHVTLVTDNEWAVRSRAVLLAGDDLVLVLERGPTGELFVETTPW